ncbi:MAG: hypothetical protein LBV04_03920 [Deferribacteraceae bacterium]|nr:hypothetical protein [Deferribacteraceae bacterium]
MHYTNTSRQKRWQYDNQSLWMDTGMVVLSSTPVASLLAEFPAIGDDYQHVRKLSYTLSFSTEPTAAIISYRNKMGAFDCGGTMCSSKQNEAYLTFEIGNAGKSLIWSVSY